MYQCGGYNGGYGYEAVTYAPYDPGTGKYSIEKGLVHSKNYLSVFDQNKDGITQTCEMPAAERHLDLNNDGVFSAGEHLAFNIFKDSTGKLDGKLTREEIYNGNRLNLQDPNYVKSKVQKLYNGHDLAQREGVNNNQGSQAGNNQFMQILTFMMMFMNGPAMSNS